MNPIQVWLPSFAGSPFFPEVLRVRERAYRAWRGEDIVWVVPGLGDSRKAVEGMVRVLAIDGEVLDRLDVFHVGSNGYAWGPGCGHRFPSGRVEGLLDAWLNASGQPLYRIEDHVVINAPDPRQEGIRYRERRLAIAPLGAMPITSVDAATSTFEARWPPPGRPTPVVSVEQESRESLGPLVRDAAEPDLPVYTCRDGSKSVLLACGWDPPLRELVGLTSFDDIQQNALMRNVAALSEGRLEEALVLAREQSQNFLSEGVSAWEHAELFPTYAKEGEAGALFAAESRFGIHATSLPALLHHPDWPAQAWRPIPIRRAWGAAGLMWALLLDHLEASRRFGPCQACGRLIPRSHARRFCSRDINESCVRERQRLRQGRHRSRRPSS